MDQLREKLDEMKKRTKWGSEILLKRRRKRMDEICTEWRSELKWIWNEKQKQIGEKLDEMKKTKWMGRWMNEGMNERINGWEEKINSERNVEEGDLDGTLKRKKEKEWERREGRVEMTPCERREMWETIPILLQMFLSALLRWLRRSIRSWKLHRAQTMASRV